jgi:hypothetical protein
MTHVKDTGAFTWLTIGRGGAMYTVPRTNYLLGRTSLIHNSLPIVQTPVISETDRIKQQLKSLGVSRSALGSAEARHLPKVIHANENIMGVVYGMSKDGFVMILVTDKRILFIDKKPFFVNEDEITFDVVSGISHGHAGIGSTVTLHTRIKDYQIKTLNEHCAHGFVEAVEARCVESSYTNMGDYRPRDF